MLSTVNYTLPTDPKNRALIDQKAQISSDTVIGDSTKVSEKSTIKKSIIGKHCIIGRMVKIVGCILLDHCVIEDGLVLNIFCSSLAYLSVSVKIDGCVLGKNTKIGQKAELLRCVTQAGYEVSAGGRLYLNLISSTLNFFFLSFFLFFPSTDTIKNEKLETTDWTTALDVKGSDDEEVTESDT